MIAFLNDLLCRPVQLWDEYWFRKGLENISINSRDVNEMERYIFALINNAGRKDETIRSIQGQAA